MLKIISIGVVLCFGFTVLGYSQGRPPARPDSGAPGRPLPSPKDGDADGESMEMRPSTSELASEDDASFTISKQVDEVNLILSVTDSKGRFVDNLTADDLNLLDNHKPPTKLNYFQARTNLPLSVILAIDVSSSVRDRLRFEQRAASVFLKHIMRKDTDEAAIIAFGSTVQEKGTGMTNDANVLDSTIRSLQAGGETAMYDAIVLAGRRLRSTKRKAIVRPVIILITDGVDTASKASLRAAEEAATRSEASIFALDANSIYETDLKGRKVLDKLTHETGGLVLSARENSDLKDAFSTIEKILRSQYAIGYAPSELEADGSFRSIDVHANKHGLMVHARNGYYAPHPVAQR
jgi:Ca-activated chloride channel family protein